MTTVTRKPLSLWSKVGLNLNEPNFAKAYYAELKVDTEKRLLYDLDRTKWESYRVHLEEKVNRTCMRILLTIADTNGKDHALIKEYSQFSDTEVKTNSTARWPGTDPTFTDQAACDKFVDNQLKADLLGKYLMNSLTDSAKRDIRSYRTEYEFTVDGEVYIDGPLYFWYIAARLIQIMANSSLK